MYETINLKDESFQHYNVGDEERDLKNLSKVNIFIGPNNSGKSRFLRGLFINDDIKFLSKDVPLAKVSDAIDRFRYRLHEALGGAKDLSRFHIKDEWLTIPEYFSEKFQLQNTFNEILRLSKLTNADFGNYTSIGGITIPALVHQVVSAAKVCLDELIGMDLDKFQDETYERKNIYIPVLRGLRGTNYIKDDTKPNYFDSYKHRTIQDYFVTNWKNEKKLDIYTGLGLYEDVKKLLLGVSSERQKIKEFESFLSETFFEGENISIVPHIDDNVVYVKIGDDEDRPIYNLGEGIQALIILTYPLFLNQGKNLNFFFEEPDLYLHPGYQRVFMETLNDPRFSSFQYFFTTHSNHFLDMTLDFQSTSIYAFHRKTKEEFIVSNIKNADKDILQSLGVRNSSVFLTNCTIWVEGITDRIYLRKYLEIFMNQEGKRKYKEDIHFSFVEYGGNNITHWSFLESGDQDHANINVEMLCGRLFLITDSDGATTTKSGKKSEKLLRQEKLLDKLGESNYHCLDCLEIENLLRFKVLKGVILDFEKTKGEGVNFSKLEKENYAQKPLGRFIEESVTGIKRTYASDSGTVANKVRFAKYAVSRIDSLEDISDNAKALAEKLYDFIATNN